MIDIITVERKDRTGLHIDSVFIDCEMARERTAAVKKGTCVEFIPLSFRKPHTDCSITVRPRCGDRGDEHVISEHILAAERIGFRTFRIIIIHRTAERNTFIIAFAGHCIYIRYHLVALAHCIADHACIGLFEHPRLLVQRTALRTMGTHDRAEGTVLKPAGVHLRVYALALVEMSSDVVAPIAVEDVRRCRCEIWLELEGLPCDGRIA